MANALRDQGEPDSMCAGDVQTPGIVSEAATGEKFVCVEDSPNVH